MFLVRLNEDVTLDYLASRQVSVLDSLSNCVFVNRFAEMLEVVRRDLDVILNFLRVFFLKLQLPWGSS